MKDELIGYFRFWDIGRMKAAFTAKLTGESSLYRVLKPHLMSQDVVFEYDMDQNHGTVFAGGFRNVGSFAKIIKSGNEQESE